MRNALLASVFAVLLGPSLAYPAFGIIMDSTQTGSVQLANSVISTVPSGGLTVGDQSMRWWTSETYPTTFTGSWTLGGISLSGPVSSSGGVNYQATTGGSVSYFDSAGSLLFSGAVGAGQLFWVIPTPNSGSWSGVLTQTGGSMLMTGPLTLELQLRNFDELPGLKIGTNGQLSPFRAQGGSFVRGELVPPAVPEPASVVSIGLGLGMLAVYGLRRRRRC